MRIAKPTRYDIACHELGHAIMTYIDGHVPGDIAVYGTYGSNHGSFQTMSFDEFIRLNLAGHVAEWGIVQGYMLDDIWDKKRYWIWYSEGDFGAVRYAIRRQYGDDFDFRNHDLYKMKVEPVWEDTKNKLLPYSEFIKMTAKKLSRTGFLSSTDFWVAIDKHGKVIQSQ